MDYEGAVKKLLGLRNTYLGQRDVTDAIDYILGGHVRQEPAKQVGVGCAERDGDGGTIYSRVPSYELTERLEAMAREWYALPLGEYTPRYFAARLRELLPPSPLPWNRR